MPIIIELVKQVEALFPEPNNGLAKREAVITMLQSAYEAADDSTDIEFQKLTPALEGAITGVVTFLRKTGIFNKKEETNS